ncbi:MAG: hypothetical protein KDB68_13945 [Planctomycetes bacterium]|nr:hypothetical protein [Planctomycetota bacterium]
MFFTLSMRMWRIFLPVPSSGPFGSSSSAPRQKQNVAIACGKSILDRSSKTNVGELMLKHGGGGHVAAGTCQVDADKADDVLKELIEAITADG